MKRIILMILMIGMVATGSLFAFEVSVQAQTPDNSYTVLAPLPCIGSDQNCQQAATKTELKDYLPGMFKLAVGIAAVSAVLMIVIGGFQYISTDAISGKSAGKDRIKNAVFGLVLVIGAWLILYTINPNLLELNLNIEEATTNAPPGSEGTLSGVLPGYSLSATQVAENTALKDKLWNDSGGKISVNADPCISGGISGCTNLVGLPPNAISGLEQLQKDFGGSLVITGGTEGGHVSHGPGQPNLDLRPSAELDKYIKDNNGQKTLLINGQTIKVNFVYESANTPGSSGPHWHTVFK
ncbi:MAG: pilin [Candidatus Zambryskibacteria bacterium]